MRIFLFGPYVFIHIFVFQGVLHLRQLALQVPFKLEMVVITPHQRLYLSLQLLSPLQAQLLTWATREHMSLLLQAR